MSDARFATGGNEDLYRFKRAEVERLGRQLEEAEAECDALRAERDQWKARSEFHDGVESDTVAALRSRLETAERARPVLEYVSRGRGYVDVEPYPDALARRVLAALTPEEDQRMSHLKDEAMNRLVEAIRRGSKQEVAAVIRSGVLTTREQARAFAIAAEETARAALSPEEDQGEPT